jgi:hypothetical protein
VLDTEHGTYSALAEHGRESGRRRRAMKRSSTCWTPGCGRWKWRTARVLTLRMHRNPLEDMNLLAEPDNHLQFIMKQGRIYHDRL